MMPFLIAHVIDGDVGGIALLVHQHDVGGAVHPRHQDAAFDGAQPGFAAAFIDHLQQRLGIIAARHDQIAHAPSPAWICRLGLPSRGANGGIGGREHGELAIAPSGLRPRRNPSAPPPGWNASARRDILHDVAIRQHRLAADHGIHHFDIDAGIACQAWDRCGKPRPTRRRSSWRHRRQTGKAACFMEPTPP